MLAKDIQRKAKRSSFRRLVKYLVNPKGTQQRVGHIEISNCESTTVDGTILEVLNTQAQNERASEKTMHLLVSFQQSDDPSPATLLQIERRLIQALGFDEHQRISVVHHDTDNLHVHIALNRIHPRTLKCHSPQQTYYLLAYASETLERELNLLPETRWHMNKQQFTRARIALRDYLKNTFVEDAVACTTWSALHNLAALHGVAIQQRGRGLIFRHQNRAETQGSRVSRTLSLARLEKKLGSFEKLQIRAPAPLEPERQRSESPAMPHNSAPPLPEMEPLADVESFRGWVRRHCADAMLAVTNWQALHDLCAVHNFRIQKHGNGLIFVTRDGLRIKGSSVSRVLSKSALEGKLGPFCPEANERNLEPKHTSMTYTSRGLVGGERLYQRFEADQNRRRMQKRLGLAALAAREKCVWQTMALQTRRFAALPSKVASFPFAQEIWQRYVNYKADRNRSRIQFYVGIHKAELHQRYRREGWLEWLRRQAGEGDEEALQALRDRSQHRMQPRTGPSPTRVYAPSTLLQRSLALGPDDLSRGSVRLYEQFISELATRRHQVATQTADLGRAMQAAETRLARRLLRRWALLDWLAPSKSSRRIWATHLLDNDRRERAALRQMFAQRYYDIQTRPELRWESWLHRQAEAGHPEARLHSPSPFAAVDHITSEGTIVYNVPGAVVREHRHGLTLSSASNDAALEGLLHVAVARLGTTLEVDGNPEFQQRLVQVAATQRFPISFADPNLEQDRISQYGNTQQETEHDSKRTEGHRTSSATRGTQSTTGGGTNTHPRATTQSYARRTRKRRQASPLDSMSSMPPCNVVHNRALPRVLLPDYAGPDIQRSEREDRYHDHELRRRHRIAGSRAVTPADREPQPSRKQTAPSPKTRTPKPTRKP